MLLGAHQSIAGGLFKAFARAEADGCEAVQIFVKNARGWKAKPLTDEEVDAFRAARAESSVRRVFAHASYLINLAAPSGELREKSLDACADELERCARLGLDGLVLHPGSSPEREAGLARVIEAIDQLFDRVPGTAELWIENTAGQGSTLASRFEELGTLLQGVRRRSRVGICFDTCHAFAAGYDLSDAAGYRATFEALERALGGLGALRAFHLNDSKKPLGSRVDRHEEVGLGALGSFPFAALLRDQRFAALAGVLETPSPERYGETLRELRAGA